MVESICGEIVRNRAAGTALDGPGRPYFALAYYFTAPHCTMADRVAQAGTTGPGQGGDGDNVILGAHPIGLAFRRATGGVGTLLGICG